MGDHIFRVQIMSSGWLGAPGYNTIYFWLPTVDQSFVDQIYTRVHALTDAIKGVYSKSVALTTVSEIDEIDSANGQVQKTWACTPGTVVQGTSLVVGLAPPGIALLVQQKTGTFVGGHRIQGRHYIGPVGPYQLQDNGTPSEEARGALQGAFQALASDGGSGHQQVIWSRPRKANSGKKGNLPARDGSFAVVTSTSCADMFASMRSRRP